jgi:Holliday junction DNA helicase RuvA
MIEQIQGVLVKKTPTFCVVDCGGIGIGVNITLHTYKKMSDLNQAAELLTYLHVREDVLQLFGFSEEQERDFFKQLISISGVGPRLAMTILSGLSVQELRNALLSGDIERLTKVPGVGRKTAQRVILEMKEKLDIPDSDIISVLSSFKKEQQTVIDEAFQALLTLGYKHSDAKTSLEKVIKKHGEDLNIEDFIKYALREK